jgi:hypothetical protein
MRRLFYLRKYVLCIIGDRSKHIEESKRLVKEANELTSIFIATRKTMLSKKIKD